MILLFAHLNSLKSTTSSELKDGGYGRAGEGGLSNDLSNNKARYFPYISILSIPRFIRNVEGLVRWAGVRISSAFGSTTYTLRTLSHQLHPQTNLFNHSHVSICICVAGCCGLELVCSAT
ncbi:unnamed protein product [Allacma fusca]|uniref:Uncharacterized protein n=1 Tax=Allacma fusca TaxID=39272 RepID=A0A8J2NST8_9HEXA|nr:unnamed protein product [Allacma fusca]